MNRLSAYILIGAPGSGKSTWGKKFESENPGIVRLCPDEFRAKFGWGEGDQAVSARAFSATMQGMQDALSTGKNVIIDATNMYRKTRKQFVSIAKRFNANTVAVVFEVDRQTLIERNQKRGSDGGRNVPENIIDNMLAKYQRPDTSEFSQIKFVSRNGS